MTAKIPPVRAAVLVHRPREAVFTAFTADFGRWWPVKAFSISEARAVRCGMEPGQGGAIFEERDDGERLPWGEVLVWSPPERLVLAWHPGYPAETAQEVEVRFSTRPEGTLVELEHRDWERLGDRARASRDSYEGGWRTVLERHFAPWMDGGESPARKETNDG